MTAASLTVLSLWMRYTCASAVLTTVTPRYTSSGAAGVLLLQLLLQPVLMTSTTLLCTYSAAAVPCCGDRLSFTYTILTRRSVARAAVVQAAALRSRSHALLFSVASSLRPLLLSLYCSLCQCSGCCVASLCLCWRLRLHVQVRLLYYC